MEMLAGCQRALLSEVLKISANQGLGTHSTWGPHNLSRVRKCNVSYQMETQINTERKRFKHPIEQEKRIGRCSPRPPTRPTFPRKWESRRRRFRWACLCRPRRPATGTARAWPCSTPLPWCTCTRRTRRREDDRCNRLLQRRAGREDSLSPFREGSKRTYIDELLCGLSRIISQVHVCSVRALLYLHIQVQREARKASGSQQIEGAGAPFQRRRSAGDARHYLLAPGVLHAACVV